ncbi:hypothetical protein HC928_08410 [bacterium]|nr:hypothetical protein [bacterium]
MWKAWAANMTEKVGLIGWPLGHSISPALHNAAFRALGMDLDLRADAHPAGHRASGPA